MKDRAVLIAGLIGGVVGVVSASPFALYFGFGKPVFATVVVGVGILLAGAGMVSGFCAALAWAVEADRRSGGYRCRGVGRV
ncbi:hypothetical protein [Nocardia wallacei]|uniref:hypothetical protein n=1 Tax=Nocardia wallacei TaxID=480035 RepID=UPI002457C546|nr:hypothetical protein [Nocardia wallacei]